MLLACQEINKFKIFTFSLQRQIASKLVSNMKSVFLKNSKKSMLVKNY